MCCALVLLLFAFCVQGSDPSRVLGRVRTSKLSRCGVETRQSCCRGDGALRSSLPRVHVPSNCNLHHADHIFVKAIPTNMPLIEECTSLGQTQSTRKSGVFEATLLPCKASWPRNKGKRKEQRSARVSPVFLNVCFVHRAVGGVCSCGWAWKAGARTGSQGF